MQVKLNSFDIRKPSVTIEKKDIIIVTKTVKEMVSQSGLATLTGAALKSINGTASWSGIS